MPGQLLRGNRFFIGALLLLLRSCSALSTIIGVLRRSAISRYELTTSKETIIKLGDVANIFPIALSVQLKRTSANYAYNSRSSAIYTYYRSSLTNVCELHLQGLAIYAYSTTSIFRSQEATNYRKH